MTAPHPQSSWPDLIRPSSGSGPIGLDPRIKSGDDAGARGRHRRLTGKAINAPHPYTSSSPLWRGSIPLNVPTLSAAGQPSGMDPCDKHRDDESAGCWRDGTGEAMSLPEQRSSSSDSTRISRHVGQLSLDPRVKPEDDAGAQGRHRRLTGKALSTCHPHPSSSMFSSRTLKASRDLMVTSWLQILALASLGRDDRGGAGT
jgi:hypothetical protein